VLAGNDVCAVQAFRAGPQAWGLQFHVEVLETTVAEWATVPAYRAALQESDHDADRLGLAVADHLAGMAEVTGMLAAGLVARVGAQSGPKPSRGDPERPVARSAPER
jgi:hypothetical protein